MQKTGRKGCESLVFCSISKLSDEELIKLGEVYGVNIPTNPLKKCNKRLSFVLYEIDNNEKNLIAIVLLRRKKISKKDFKEIPITIGDGEFGCEIIQYIILNQYKEHCVIWNALLPRVKKYPLEDTKRFSYLWSISLDGSTQVLTDIIDGEYLKIQSADGTEKGLLYYTFNN